MHFTKELPRHYLRMLKTAVERHHSQSLQSHGLLLIFSFIVSSGNAQSITLVKDTVLPVRGSSFGMSCILSLPFTSNGISLLRNGIILVSCTSRGCVFGNWYTSKVNQTGVFITISSLDRDSHEGSWTCIYAAGTTNNIISNPVNLYVYTLPTGIRVTQEPSENVDLSMTSATFQCSTIGCSYPDPVIQWMYENQDIIAGVQTSTSDGCTSTEKIYTNTLFIQRNSTLSDNSDKTFVFSCRTDYPDPSINIRASATKSVRFAVRVTEVVLQQNNKNITDLLTVNFGEQVALTCMTGLCRPDPTIDWYIGSQKRGNGPSLNFTPSNADHNQIIYCQAYNTDPNAIVYSLKPRLSVQVRVTEAVLQQNNQNVSDMLTVISGKPITLTCMTGLSRPDPTIDWYIGSQKRGNGPSLNFTPSNADHEETIYCQAYNTDPNRIVYSLKPRLSVEVYVSNITLDPPGDIITFLDGTANSLRCTTSPSRPQPVIRWWLDGNEVTNQTITRVTGTGTLFIASSELLLIVGKTQHGKKVRCDAKVNDQADVIESVKPEINVWYQPSLPSVQAFQGNFPWLENQTGTLQCVAADYGNPRASVIWISSRGTLDMDSDLVFKNLSADDHGQPVYCQVQNNFTVIKGLTVVSPTVALNVEYRPIITLNPSVQPLRIKEGSNLTVTCMASGNPQPIVQWKNRNPPSNTLLIPSILRNNTGSYTCVASSTSTNYNHVLLQREESTRVIVELTPEKPINFHVTNVQEKQLSLKWLSGYHWGFGQMFVVEASIDNKTWINVSQVDSGNIDGWFSTTVGNLIPGSDYYLRLYAYNINGRGDFADVQLEVRTLKESAHASSMEVSSAVGISVGGAVGVGVGGAAIGFIGAIITFAFRRRLHVLPGNKSSCFRSKGNTDEEMHTYSNTEMNPQTVKPIYEELNKGNKEQSIYDKISPL